MMTKSEYLIKYLDGKGKIYIRHRHFEFKQLDKLQLDVKWANNLHRKQKKYQSTGQP